MRYLSIFLFFTFLYIGSIQAQNANIQPNKNTNLITFDMISMEIIEGCLKVEVNYNNYQMIHGVLQNAPYFRLSLTKEQLELNENLKLKIYNEGRLIMSGILNSQNASTAPIIFANNSSKIYTVSVSNFDETYQCSMNITLK